MPQLQVSDHSSSDDFDVWFSEERGTELEDDVDECEEDEYKDIGNFFD